MKQGTRRYSHICLALALTAILSTGCKKKQEAESPSAPDKEAANEAPKTADLSAQFGSAVLVPADYEWVAVYGDLARGWGQLKQTKLVSGAIEILDSIQAQKGAAPAPGAPPSWQAVLGDLCSEEAFIAGPPGSSASTRQLQEVMNSARYAQIRSQLMSKVPGAPPQPGNATASQLTTIIPLLAELPLPAMIAGFKVTGPDGPALQHIHAWEAKLPATVTKSKMTPPNGPELTVYSATWGDLIPEAMLTSVSAQLVQGGMTEEEATALLGRLKERDVSVAWGLDGKQLLLSIGEDQRHLRYAASPKESIASVELLQKVLPYADKPMFSFGYVTADAMKNLQGRPSLVELFDKLSAAAGGMVPEEEIQKIRGGIEEADRQLAPTRPKKIEATVGAAWFEGGLKGEQFGGILPGALASDTSRRLAPPAAMTEALWLNWNADPKATLAAFAGVVRLASTVYDAFWRIAPQMMPEPKIQQARMVEQLAVPKIQELFSIVTDLSTSALGPEAALTMDLEGALPALPNIPPNLAEKPIAPRLALICEVSDREKLTVLWGRTLRLAAEVGVLLPPQTGLAGGIPEPQVSDFAGGKTYYYIIPTPVPLGEHVPNVTITDSKLEIFSTSNLYPQKLAATLGKSPESTTPAFAEARVNFEPVWTTAKAFAEMAPKPADPAAPGAAAPDFATVLSTLEHLKAIDYRAYEEDGSARRTSVLRFE